MTKLLRVTTVPLSLQKLITGQLIYMRSNGFEPLMVSADGPEIEKAIEEQGCLHIKVKMTRKITPWQDLVSLWNFYKLCKKHKPDIIHSHTPKAGIIGMLGAKLAGVPVRLHTVAGLPLMESKGLKRFILDTVEKLTYASATRVYPNSKNLRNFILDNRFCKPQKVKVIGNGSSNGINTEYFKKDVIERETLQKLRLDLNIDESDFIYVFIGRLVKDKGVQELVKAFKKIHKNLHHTKLILVGPFEQNLDPLDENTLHDIKQNPAIISVGYQNDVRPYLALSHVLVFPSYREGFPNVPMQAGCFELPSIVTNINGCNEIIEDGVNGLIINPKSEVDLKEAMEKLVVDTDLYDTLKANARKMIVDRYEQRYFWSLLLTEYREVLISVKK